VEVPGRYILCRPCALAARARAGGIPGRRGTGGTRRSSTATGRRAWPATDAAVRERPGGILPARPLLQRPLHPQPSVGTLKPSWLENSASRNPHERNSRRLSSSSSRTPGACARARGRRASRSHSAISIARCRGGAARIDRQPPDVEASLLLFPRAPRPPYAPDPARRPAPNESSRVMVAAVSLSALDGGLGLRGLGGRRQPHEVGDDGGGRPPWRGEG
jgi:hypothetical protein